MDIIKTINEIPEKLFEAGTFFWQFVCNLFLLTFNPKKFTEKFSWSIPDRKLYTNSFLFLFTSIFFIEAIVKIIDRYLDAKASIDDVGLSAVLQAENLWNISWEVVLYNTIPIVLLMFSIGWLLTVICVKDKKTKMKLLVIFPYVAWRSVTLLLFNSIILIICLAILILLIYIFFKQIFLWFFFTYQFIFITLCTITIFFTLKKVQIFISQLLPESHSYKSKFSDFLFRFGIVASLLIPIWWSFISLSSPASKIAIKPQQIIPDNRDTVTINVSLRNLSNEPLFTKNEGNAISWWDDENPVYIRDIFSNTRVANGKFYLFTTEDQELSDGFKKITYIGRQTEAHLVPKSFSSFDFMGGPEAMSPTQKENDLARLSFLEILNDSKKGRIDLTIVVSTKGGRISKRTVTIYKSNQAH